MRKLALVGVCVAFTAASAAAQDAATVIANAKKALGDAKSITYSGSAKDVAFQQCGANATQMNCQGPHNPMRPITNYVRVIDLAGPTSRHTGGTNNIGPGGSTVTSQGTFFAQVTPQQADLAQPWANSIELYLTPWGFLEGASKSGNATAKKDGKYTVITWSPAVKAPSGKAYTINGYVNAQNQIERVETWVGENIMGDMHVVATYSGWKDMGGGAIVPTKIVQTRGGWPFFEVDVTAASLNPPNVAALAPAPAPPAGRGGGPPPGGGPGGPPALTVTQEKLGEGLTRLTTGPGSYDSIVVEFKDYVMMLEGGQPEARGLAYIAEVKKMYPNKPLRYVWNSHPHADHTGGLPAFVAEGVTIVTQQNNKEFFERALNTPRTLLNDSLAKSPKKVKIETIGEKKVFSDGTRTVEFYHIYPSPHSNGLTVAYIPKEKILFQADYTLPAPGQQPNDHIKALQAAMEKLNLDFDKYLNVHREAAPQTKADLMKAGK
ncbi:MAG TPA: MBL fold metallo-hydrolase [Vicinamibacterales bacterium]|nr:MBL fold metallo-hydrolase [Vicinamibacterales bacterium]